MTSTALAVRESERGDIFADPAAFEHWQRVAGMFAASEIIPQHLRGHLPDVLIGLDLARRLSLNPLSVLQNLYVVRGNPGWKTTFLIALAHSAGWELDWQIEELQPGALKFKRKIRDGVVDAAMPNLRVRCTMERGGRAKLGPWVSSEQAIAARWADNEQYSHSAELMLRYRAAAFAVRLHDPNVLLGLPTAEEAAEVQAPERVVLEPEPAAPPRPARGAAVIDAALDSRQPPSTSPAAPQAPPVQAPAAPADTSGADPSSGGGQDVATPDPEQDARALLRVLAGRSGEVLVGDVADQWKAQLGLRQLRSARAGDAVRWGASHGLWTADFDVSGRALSVTLGGDAEVADHRSPARRDLEAAIADLERDLEQEAVEEARRSVDMGVRMPLGNCATDLLERYRDALDAAIPEPGSDDGGEG